MISDGSRVSVVFVCRALSMFSATPSVDRITCRGPRINLVRMRNHAPIQKLCQSELFHLWIDLMPNELGHLQWEVALKLLGR